MSGAPSVPVEPERLRERAAADRDGAETHAARASTLSEQLRAHRDEAAERAAGAVGDRHGAGRPRLLHAAERAERAEVHYAGPDVVHLRGIGDPHLTLGGMSGLQSEVNILAAASSTGTGRCGGTPKGRAISEATLLLLFQAAAADRGVGRSL